MPHGDRDLGAPRAIAALDRRPAEEVPRVASPRRVQAVIGEGVLTTISFDWSFDCAAKPRRGGEGASRHGAVGKHQAPAVTVCYV